MRSIKFRAWDTESKIMRYDDYCLRFETALVTGKYGQEFHEMIPLQYTGINDKNKTEIYEGDILSNLRADYKYKVIWEVCEFICYHLDTGIRWGRLSRLNDADMADIYHNIEVTGNIYEEQK